MCRVSLFSLNVNAFLFKMMTSKIVSTNSPSKPLLTTAAHILTRRPHQWNGLSKLTNEWNLVADGPHFRDQTNCRFAQLYILSQTDFLVSSIDSYNSQILSLSADELSWVANVSLGREPNFDFLSQSTDESSCVAVSSANWRMCRRYLCPLVFQSQAKSLNT